MKALNKILNKILRVRQLSNLNTLLPSLILNKIAECFPFYHYRLVVFSSTIPANLPTDARRGRQKISI